MRRMLVVAAAVAGLATACGDDGGGGNDPTTTAPSTGLANPSAVFCVDSGGTYDLDGGTCTLPNGEVVDAWQYFYEQNPTSSTTG